MFVGFASAQRVAAVSERTTPRYVINRLTNQNGFSPVVKYDASPSRRSMFQMEIKREN